MNVAKLNFSLYGTRDAAQNWTEEYAKKLVRLGLSAGVATPCHFQHDEKELFVTVHGDDFTVVGPSDSLNWVKRKMEEFEVIDPREKTREFVGEKGGKKGKGREGGKRKE